MMKVAPDTARINIRVARVLATYDEAYEQGKQNLIGINSVVEETGISTELVKTHRFEVTEHTKPDYKHGKYVGYVKDGYDLDQRISIDLDIDNVLVNDIVKGIGQSVPMAEVSLLHLIKSPRTYKLKVLALAVKDAAEKAQVIADALDCQLGAIKEVVYGADDYDGSMMYESDCDCKCADPSGASLDIHAVEEEIHDEVRITWYIINK